MTETRCNISPNPKLMDWIAATNLSVSEAIGELIANSLDAKIGGNPVHILVDLSKKDQISVVDDGKGMPSEILAQAIRLAVDMSEFRDRGRDAKGHFGMGFKTACSTLGGEFTIYTRPLGEHTELMLPFDLDEFVERKGESAWTVTITERSPSLQSPLRDRDNGTAFIISRIRPGKKADPGAVTQYLQRAFKAHFKMGDEISIRYRLDGQVITTVLEPEQEEYIDGTKIPIDEVFGDKKQYHVTGWMGLSPITHNDGNYGFQIFRKNQLLQSWNKDWFPPHLMTSRIIGEVNADFLEATFYKQGMQKTELWNDTCIHMREYLKALVTASRDISRKHNIDNNREKEKIINRMRGAYGEPKLETKQLSKQKETKATPKDNKIVDVIPAVYSEESVRLEDGTEIKIKYMPNDRSAEEIKELGPYDYLFNDDDEPPELQVYVYRKHPIWSNKYDSKFDEKLAQRLATGDALFQILTTNLGWKSAAAKRFKLDWLWNINQN